MVIQDFSVRSLCLLNDAWFRAEDSNISNIFCSCKWLRESEIGRGKPGSETPKRFEYWNNRWVSIAVQFDITHLCAFGRSCNITNAVILVSLSCFSCDQLRLRSIPIARSCHIHFAEDSLSVNQFVLMLTSPSRTFIESTANFTPSQVSLNEVRDGTHVIPIDNPDISRISN